MSRTRHISRPSTHEAQAKDRAYVLSLTAKQLARLIGGNALSRDSRGREGAHGPGPGHGHGDRSMVVRIDPASPDGFVVYTFSPRDDWRACKDYVRERLGLPTRMFRRPHTPSCATKKTGQTGHSASSSQARRLWKHSQPPAGTPVEHYLESRAILATDAIRILPAKPPQYPHLAMIVPFTIPVEPEPGHLVIPCWPSVASRRTPPLRSIFRPAKALPPVTHAHKSSIRDVLPPPVWPDTNPAPTLGSKPG